MDRWALFVAVLALGFTAYAFFRQHGLQQRLAAIEEDRRREEVASSSGGGGRGEVREPDSRAPPPRIENYQLVLSNAGQARAEEVTVELVGPIEGNAPDLVMRGELVPYRVGSRPGVHDRRCGGHGDAALGRRTAPVGGRDRLPRQDAQPDAVRSLEPPLSYPPSTATRGEPRARHRVRLRLRGTPCERAAS